MNETRTTNRREVYRQRPGPNMDPSFSIIHGGGRARAERVLDISARGARVEFLASTVPHLKPGSDVVAAIQAPELAGCLDLPAQVVFVAQRGEARILALMFPRFPDNAGLDGDLFRLFNRRRSERVGDPGTGGGKAWLVADDIAGAETSDLTVRVVNHSAGGICFIIDEDSDHLIRDRPLLHLMLGSGPQAPATMVSARVLHRATCAGAVYYGCVLDS